VNRPRGQAEQRVQRLVDGRVVNQMIVVEHQPPRATGGLGGLPEKQGQGVRQGAGGVHRRRKVRELGLDARDQPLEEVGRVVVHLAEGRPQDAVRLVLRPIPQQRRFAIPGRSDDEGESRVNHPVERGLQMGPWQFQRVKNGS